MGVSVGPNEDGMGPGQAASPLPPMADRRTGRRIVGVFGLIVALVLDLVHLSTVGIESDYLDHSQVNQFLLPANVQLLALLIGLIACLVGSLGALRVAKLCAVAFFVSVLVEVIVGQAMGAFTNPHLTTTMAVTITWAVIPGLFLVAGIVAMRPSTGRPSAA